MSEMTKLLTTLRQAGLLTQDIPSIKEMTTPTPWFVQALHALSGWLASIFFLLMLGSMFSRLFDTPPALLAIGIVLIVLAFLILRNPSKTLFLEHGALAISLAGQALISFAFFQWGRPHTLTYPFPWLALVMMEGVLLIIIPHYLHRLVSALAAGLALIHAAGLLGIGTIATPLILGLTVWVWHHEFRPPDTIMFKQAAGYGLSLALFWSVSTHFGTEIFPFDHFSRSHFGLDYLGVTALLNGTIMLYTAYALTRNINQNSTLSPVALLLFLLPVALLSVWMHGLSVALTLLIVGFARGNRILQGLSLAALLWIVGRFYYTLHTTLLVKSALLIATGAALLITYAVLKHREGAKDVL